MSDDQEKKKDELVDLLGKVGPEAKKLESLGKDIVQFARFAGDAAGPLRDFYSQAPASGLPPDQLNLQVESWQSWFAGAREMLKSQTLVNSFGALSQAATNTSVSGVMTVITPPALPLTTSGSPPAPVSIPPAAQQAKMMLFQTLDRFPLVEKARQSLLRLGLDWRPGSHQTPLVLLDEARGALDMPPAGDGGAVGVLISLRECIDAAIPEIVRRRPHQEEAKGWKGKVASIGRQCARPGLATAHFDRLGIDTDTIMNQLSGAKQAGLHRQQLLEAFSRGVLFLNALLDSIDETRLKPR
jgi:hypothetical protein